MPFMQINFYLFWINKDKYTKINKHVEYIDFLFFFLKSIISNKKGDFTNFFGQYKFSTIKWKEKMKRRIS